MTLQEIKKVKAGDCLTTKYGAILLVAKVEIESSTSVRIYHYFDWDAGEKTLMMNEWLYGFYGPVFEEGFYRESTKEEKELLFSKMQKCGYRWCEEHFIPQPVPTPEEWHRRLGCNGC